MLLIDFAEHIENSKNNSLTFFSVSLLDKFKHEDLENHATINQVSIGTELFADTKMYHSKEKLDEALEMETRGVDFKGNVRYFCPKCNVRYIGELKLQLSLS